MGRGVQDLGIHTCSFCGDPIDDKEHITISQEIRICRECVIQSLLIVGIVARLINNHKSKDN